MVPACNSHDKKNGYQEMRTVQGIPEAEEKTEENFENIDTLVAMIQRLQ